MNVLKTQVIRLLSHVTCGKLKEKYKIQWSDIKEQIREEKNKPFAELLSLLTEQTRKIECLKDDIKKIDGNIFYQRVSGYGSPSCVYDYVSSIVQCAELHKIAFRDKKFLNFDKDVVICATGPTFEYYSEIKNAYHIGMNNAYKSPNLEFDALFCQDAYLVFNGKIPSDFISYRADKCVKFFGNSQPLALDLNPKNYPIFYYMSENKFNYNVDCQPLPDFTSVVFSAFAYALWTTPKRIFLVGTDCSSGHADSLNAKHSVSCQNLVEYWKYMKSFAAKFYPDVEIISINPVGLKGLFKDVYTQKYLDEHIDICDEMNQEIVTLEEILNE